MLKMSFKVKDWPKIEKMLFEKYNNKFLYINSPELDKEEAYLIFVSIDNIWQFRKMIRQLNRQGANIEITQT